MFDLQRPQLIHIGPWGRKLSRVAGSTRLFYTCKRRNRGLHVKGHLFPFSLNIRINWNNKNSDENILLLRSVSSLSLSRYIYHPSVLFQPWYTMLRDVSGSALVIRITRTSAVIRRWIFSCTYVRAHPPLVHSRAKIDRAEGVGREGSLLLISWDFFLPFSRTFKRVTREINLD